jgi:2-polyprenyl-6-methoxyphenol hydroxylase-like FAD-dependent oxidoreductase
MEKTRTAVIAGAGIGGLTAAAALSGRGWQVTVCEQATDLAPVGTAIALAPNAIRALDAIGIDVGKAGATHSGGGLRRPDGRWVVQVAIGTGEILTMLHRAELVELLASHAKDATIELGTTVTGVKLTSGASALVTSAGERPADLIVVADGSRSRLRDLLFPGQPGLRYADYSAFRFFALDPTCKIASETWGRGARFGIVPMGTGQVYCYAAIDDQAGVTYEDPKAELLRRFGDWHQPIPALIAAAGDILHHDVYDLAAPLPAYHSGTIALLGDAAHPMTPDVGQGGCQAIEDAVVLAQILDVGSVRDRLPAYTKARLARTVMITKRARQLGRIGQLSAPLAVAARDTGMRLAGLLPPRWTARAMAPVLDWRP